MLALFLAGRTPEDDGVRLELITLPLDHALLQNVAVRPLKHNARAP